MKALIPTMVQHLSRSLQVVAAIPATSTDSEVVHVIAQDPTAQMPFIVWDAVPTVDGQWRTENGHYDCSYTRALEVLVKRLRWDLASVSPVNARNPWPSCGLCGALEGQPHRRHCPSVELQTIGEGPDLSAAHRFQELRAASEAEGAKVRQEMNDFAEGQAHDDEDTAVSERIMLGQDLDAHYARERTTY